MRKMMALLLSVMLIVSLALPASAATAGSFMTGKYAIGSVDDGDAVLFYGKALLPDGTMSVSVGAREVNDFAVSTLLQSDIPVTVYCLVESTNEKRIEKEQDILRALSNMLRDQDSMVIASSAEELVESRALTDKGDQDRHIDNLKVEGWFHVLYNNINKAIETIQTNTSYNNNTVLVVLSNGQNNKDKSTVEHQDALDKIREARIPVYTVVLGNPDKTTQSDQDQLAAESVGGFMIAPEVEKLSAYDTAERLWYSISNATVIGVPMAELQGIEGKQDVLFRYEVDNTKYEDTVAVQAVDLAPYMTEPPEPSMDPTFASEETDPTETTEDPDPDDPGEDEIPLWVWIAGGVALVLVIGAVVFFVMKRKKAEQAPAFVEETNSGSSGIILDDGMGAFPMDNPMMPTEMGTPTMGIPTMGSVGPTAPVAPMTGDCHVFAVAIMHPEIKADFWLTTGRETTFGRNDKSAVVLCGKDKMLSGVHGSFYWDGKMLLVQDRNSSNGTSVNGQLCAANVWLRVEEGAVLRAGTYEYRITFQPKK